MSEVDIHELGGAYALDALDARERVAYEAHFATCVVCRREVGEYRETAAALADLAAAPVPAGLRERVLAEVATTRQLAPTAPVTDLAGRRLGRVATALLAAAAAAVLMVAGALVVASRGGDDFGDQVAAMIESPDTRAVELAGAGEGSLKLLWDGRQVAVIGGALPDPGPRRYELWMLDAAGAHPMGLLDAAEGGAVRRMLDMRGDPAGWGVTIEPPEGSDTPTMPVLFQVQLPPTEES